MAGHHSNVQMVSKATSALSITLENDFDFLSDEYAVLFKASNATVFQSPRWLHDIYTNLSKSLDAAPVVITARDTNGQLQLLLPLVRQSRFGAKIVQAADLGVSDYNTLVAKPGVLAKIAGDRDLLDKLKTQLLPFDILLFRKERDELPSINQLFTETTRTLNENQAYRVELGSDFEVWKRENMSKNLRKSSGRKLRNFSSNVGEYEFTTAETPEEIEAAFNFLRATRVERFADDLLNQEAYFNFYLNHAISTAKSGTSCTYIGRANDQIVTAEFGVVSNGTCFALLGAFLGEEYAKYSLGNLSLTSMMEQRTLAGDSWFDLTIGAEDYKQRFSATPTILHNTILTNGPVGSLMSLTYRHGGPVKEALKKLSPNVH